jgi:hypothetical protein
MLENENINEPHNPAFLVGAVIASYFKNYGKISQRSHLLI